MKGKSNKTVLVVVIIAFLGVALLGYGKWYSVGGAGKNLTTRALALTCTLDMFTRFHIHPHLTILFDGVKQAIPADIGITLGCMHPIHTHDDTGTIHVESPEQRDFTLGDFFAVWGKAFDRTQILDHKADVVHGIRMTVDGAPSDAFEDLILKDKQEILIEYTAVVEG